MPCWEVLSTIEVDVSLYLAASVQSFPVSYKKMNVDLIDKNEFQFQALQLSMHEGLRIIYGLTSVTP